MKSKDGSDILTFLCTIVIIGVLIYIIYLFIGSNNKLNINEVKDIKTDFNQNIKIVIK